MSKKRPSEKPEMPPVLKLSGGGTNADQGTLKPRLKVVIKRWHGVAKWTWGCGEGEVCGICQSAFEGVAPGVKYP